MSEKVDAKFVQRVKENMSTARSRGAKAKARPAVKGPQLVSRVLLARKRAKATGAEPPRTARIRYVEPPTKSDGNPFFAVRVRRELLDAFKKEAKSRGFVATEMVRAYMAKVTGVSAEADNDE